jgi:uncharacterized protein
LTQLNYPFHIDNRCLTATVNEEEHIRHLVEQVLFTMIGERVNRPSFGSNINQLVFAPNSGELAIATQFLVQAALQQWLGNLIHVESVEVQSEEATLHVHIQYIIRRNKEKQVTDYVRGVK